MIEKLDSGFGNSGFELKTNKEVYIKEHFYMKLDSVEQYEDANGILHVKTKISHEELDEENVWEVFDASDGASPLELLLDI